VFPSTESTVTDSRNRHCVTADEQRRISVRSAFLAERGPHKRGSPIGQIMLQWTAARRSLAWKGWTLWRYSVFYRR